MYDYELEFKVRDYECDLQGIVNNAVYQNYLEHTRHEYFLENNVSFAEMHDKNVDAVVSRVEISYKESLRSGDHFVSRMKMKREGVKYVFYQDIIRKSDDKLCVKAKTDVVMVIDGHLAFSHPLMDALLK